MITIHRNSIFDSITIKHEKQKNFSMLHRDIQN